MNVKWEVANVRDVQAGDRITLDEDALDALKAGRPEDVDWTYVGEDAVVVQERRRVYGSQFQWELLVEGGIRPIIRAREDAEVVREIRA